MKANEKAKYLYDQTIVLASDLTIEQRDRTAKKSALLCVDEIDLYIQQCTPKDDPYANLMALEYWQEVRREIEKL